MTHMLNPFTTAQHARWLELQVTLAAKFARVRADIRREAEREAARLTVEQENSMTEMQLRDRLITEQQTGSLPLRRMVGQENSIHVRGSGRWAEVRDEESGPEADWEEEGRS